MKEEIDWKEEVLESGRFNDQFSNGLLDNVAKNFMQGIYLGYMYSRWRKIRGLEKDDPVENKGQMQSSFKEFEKKIKWKVFYNYGEGVIWTQNWPQYSSVILEIKDQTAEKDSILYYTKSENVILSAP